VSTTLDVQAGPDLSAQERLERVRARLVRPMPTDTVLGWFAPLLVTLVAFFLRLYRLGTPAKDAFDEVYYRCDAKMLLQYSYEHSHTAPPDCVAEGGPSFIVHPPLGKWMIALGQQLFGGPDDHFASRIMAVIVGSLSVLIVCRVGRRMFRSTLLGCIAGGLLTLDGMHFVQSRIAMLDIFLMFWVVAAFGCLVVDRDQGRDRLAERLTTYTLYPGPSLGFRPWRLAAGVCIGAAFGTKWSALFYVVVLLLLAFAWDVGARRAAGIPRPFSTSFWREIGLLGVMALCAVMEVLDKPETLFGLTVTPLIRRFIILVAVGMAGWRAALEYRRRSLHSDRAALRHTLLPEITAVVLVGIVAGTVYVATWAGWFATDGGWRRTCQVPSPWAAEEDCGGFLALKGFKAYHDEILNFHDNLGTNHAYQSSPWGWLFLARPVSYFYETPRPNTSQEILSIGTPAIWWGAIFGLLVTGWGWVSRRDWRAAAILLGFAAGYLPWFKYPDRTMFLFYALPALPFMCLALAYACGVAIGPTAASFRRRTAGTIGVGAYLTLVVVNFAYLYPILSAQVISYASWRNHMWLNSWI
jgi:dolichyl-phosphate-mannose--protein O-mannosyl transferase